MSETSPHQHVLEVLRHQKIETPSWAYGNSGTRFKVFPKPGVPRSVEEKIDDAATVHRLTGVAPSIALHIPWDAVGDYAALGRYAQDRGIRLGAINPNLFQDEDYRLGSVCNPDPAVRRKAVRHLLDCVEIATQTGSEVLSVWLADGTNYLGQDDIRARQDRLGSSLAEVYAAMPATMRMLLEYKFFEPHFYTMDVPDWGTAFAHCLRLGERAQVLVDTGHHAPGVNIEFLVAVLLREGRLGGFHFNSRNYADDDLMVGAADPFQLFRILHEINGASGLATGSSVAFMLDQCHNLEPSVPAMIRSVLNVQEATAKALLVDRGALAAAQHSGDVLGAHEVVTDAFRTDVRPLLAELRQSQGLHPEPLVAYRESGYQRDIEAARPAGGVGWGA
ncbi:L-rhamnose isomerase/sugar isomerase [Crossiella equi]|uniref:L-rhamnose isomerase/sugar isomerase n=1 Tax=Crossiella equi TaxID=130796 RepID=A0ABS5AM97_9PSEU|nr:L-rhamnose isomerase [Crossiella equi]MBP2477531.1 L-rhamnose isomerase/sugar isomerase [Crossiella equi]